MNNDANVDDELYCIRHSLAHVLAQAVQVFRPGTKLGFGPAISDGFYYDFILPEPITETDFPEIEKLMKRIIKQQQKFEFEDLAYEPALQRLADMGEPYKVEYAKELFEKQNLSALRFYTNGPFVDMCEGPHVTNTNKIPAGAFKLRSVAGAYWRGDEKNSMMTRIYAWAFKDREALQAHEKAFKLLQERDHKKLGKELDIFVIDEIIGKGLPLWLPNGTIIRDELQKYMEELEFKGGYQRVTTPQLAKSELYYQTGHLPYYKEGMFPFLEMKESSEDGSEEIKEEYCLRPMNCPHHHRVFAARKHSYRELPIRYAEYGQVYRYEDSGAVSGLLRVRGMCMNDAHIYCTEEQAKEEFLAVMKMHEELYATFGIKDYHMRFSTWDADDPKGKEKYIDNPAAWEKAQRIVKEAMDASGLPYVEGKGEAAFYGPKIDFQFKTVTGREETASTNQLDFGIAERMDLKYTDSDNTEKRPYIIHRAPAGTHERFIAFLIEHFGGAFPTWIAPVQVRIVTVSDVFNVYGEKLVRDLRSNFVRADIENSSETMGKKVRTALKRKIPNILILGEKEMNDETVTLRRYGQEEQKIMPYSEFKSWILERIQSRSLN